MHLKSARCLSCQSAVIFINNSKNILWESFCFQIRSCDSFSTREHWVNCHVLTGQWMGSFKAKLMMNWYLLRPKQAQGTIYTRPSVLCAMMDGGEPRRRSHRDTLKLTTRQRQADGFNQAAERNGFFYYLLRLHSPSVHIDHGYTVPHWPGPDKEWTHPAQDSSTF